MKIEAPKMCEACGKHISFSSSSAPSKTMQNEKSVMRNNSPLYDSHPHTDNTHSWFSAVFQLECGGENAKVPKSWSIYATHIDTSTHV